MLANISGVVPGISDFWPGKTSYVIFFSGCNFNCPNCDSRSVIKFHRGNDKDLKDIKRDILSNIAQIDSLIFTGGEPAMNRQALVDLARFAKKNRLSVGIETNGSKPGTIRTLVEESLLDFIALDIKAPDDPKKFEKSTKSRTFFIMTDQIMANIKQTLSILNDNQDKLEVEFRTTITPTMLFKKEDILAIAGTVSEFPRANWVLQRFSQLNVSHKMLSDILPPSYTFMQTLQDSIRKAHPNLLVEVRERKSFTFPEPEEIPEEA